MPQRQTQIPFAFGYVGPARVHGTIAVDRLLLELTSEAVEIELVLLGLLGDHAESGHSAADWWTRGNFSRICSEDPHEIPMTDNATREIRLSGKMS